MEAHEAYLANFNVLYVQAEEDVASEEEFA